MAAQQVQREQLDADAALDLLKEILAGVPRLTGAACIGRHELFDPVAGNGRQYQRQEQIRRAEAAQVCTGCPMIQRCTSVTVAVAVEAVIPAPRRAAPPAGGAALGEVMAVTVTAGDDDGPPAANGPGRWSYRHHRDRRR